MTQNKHELVGKVMEIAPVVMKKTKAGKDYPVRTMKLDLTQEDAVTGERKFENIVELEFGGDFICEKIDELSAGEYAKVKFDVSGWWYTDKKTGAEKCFTKVRPFNVEKVSTEQPQQAQPTPQPQSLAPAEDDTLPF